MACRYLCKQFNFNYKRVKRNKRPFIEVKGICYLLFFQTQELQKYMLEFDVDNDGMLDFEEFKLAIKFAQGKMKNRDRNEDGEF